MSDEDQVIDEAENDDTVEPLNYEVTNYGVDFDVEGLVKRMRRGDIITPHFQREFIWKIAESSRFIESLLLGLPVPGIFLVQEQGNRFLVIDGQQRLKSLLFFYDGKFNPSAENKRQKNFRLTGVIKKYEELTYDDLQERDRRALDDTVIHATVVKQEDPKEDDTSIYHIYERLNSSGQILKPQEVRCAVYHGKLIESIGELNDYSNWRTIFGAKNSRLKDQELILRFFAMYWNGENYQPPMKGFITRFTKKYRKPDKSILDTMEKIFKNTIDIFYGALGKKAFRLENNRALNAAVFDSMMYGLARRLYGDPNDAGEVIGSVPTADDVKKVHDAIIKESDYIKATKTSTAGKESVSTRLRKVQEAFARV